MTEEERTRHWSGVEKFLTELVARAGDRPVSLRVVEANPTEAVVVDVRTGSTLVAGTRVHIGAWIGGGLWSLSAAAARMANFDIQLEDVEGSP